MLNLLVLGSGAVLMGLELLGSRILAPFFGNSLVVWGSLISVFLTALSLGYLLGGRAADRWPHPGTLVRVVLAAGLWVAILPWITAPLLGFLADSGMDPRAGTLLASLLLFLGPGVLMGMVSPLAIRLRAQGLERLGKDAGGLYALSTAGSIGGTLLTSFWLIPALGSRALLLAFGVTLLALAGGYAMAGRQRAETGLAVLLAAAVLVTTLPSFAPQSAGTGGNQNAGAGAGQNPGAAGEKKTVRERMGGQTVELAVLHEVDSLYHHIRVMEGAGSRYLRFDNSWQSGMYVDDPFKTRFEYTDFFSLAYAMGPRPKRVLMVGLGGGSTPKHLWKFDPEVRVDVVELDPEVVRVAREYFALPEDERIRVFTQDGRRYLEETQERYDLILLDAYYADSIPFHLATKEFLELAKSRLAPGGIVEANVIGAYTGPHSSLYRSFHKTFADVFPTVYSFPVYWSDDPESRRNITLVATENSRIAPEALVEQAQGVGAQNGVPRLAEHAADQYLAPVETSDVPLLTDDHAPVDQLLHFGD